MRAADLDGARIELRGSRFTSTGMGEVYEGSLDLDTAANPRRTAPKQYRSSNPPAHPPKSMANGA